MNVHLPTRMKRSASSRLTGEMMIIIIITFYAVTFSLFLFAPNFGVKAYAQENNNSTLILEDMRTIMRDQQRDIASIRNTSSAEAGALTQMAMSSSRLAIQATYTALSVFFLGLGLVIFGLRLTTRHSPQIGKYFTIAVGALTIPVIILVALFQYGIFTGNNLLASLRNEDPFFLLSLLLYVPIAIIVFLLLGQKRIMHAQAPPAAQAAQAAQAATSQGKKDPYQELERLAGLKQQGLISEEEFQKLKMRLLSGI